MRAKLALQLRRRQRARRLPAIERFSLRSLWAILAPHFAILARSRSLRENLPLAYAVAPPLKRADWSSRMQVLRRPVSFAAGGRASSRRAPNRIRRSNRRGRRSASALRD